jgi:hypothetical protein
MCGEGGGACVLTYKVQPRGPNENVCTVGRQQGKGGFWLGRGKGQREQGWGLHCVCEGGG